MSTANTFDATEFRKALGTFATGVTIITTRAADGSPLGLTVNSFNSVSLSPPLVLWSLSNSSNNLPAFRAAKCWAVHVLSADQQELSARFARRGGDKFSGLELQSGVDGIPLLPGCTARFQCRTAFQYEGGDHVIFVGEVTSFDRAETAPLVFHGGDYAHAARRDISVKPRHAQLAGSFSDDFLGYLLGRSHFQFFGQIRQLLLEAGLSDEEFYVLSALTLKETMTTKELSAGLAGVLDEGRVETLQALVWRGFARNLPGEGQSTDTAFQLTEMGSECVLRLITAAKEVESKLLERFGKGETAMLKSLLNRLLSVIDPGAAALWEPPAAAGKEKSEKRP